MLIFLFTDIEGSTRLWEKHTEEMGGVIARHDAILQEQIGECGGRITHELTHPDLQWHEFSPRRFLSGNSISRTTNQRGQQLMSLTPSAIAVGLASATLLPTLLGDVSPSSPALFANFGVLSDLGANALLDFVSAYLILQRARSQP